MKGRGGGGSQIYEARKNGKKPPNAKWLALLINKHFIDYVEKCENHPDRIISCKIKLHGNKSLQIIQVYAPTGNHDNETVEMFYEKLEKNLNNKACSYHVVMREFNAKIGMRNKTLNAQDPLEQATEMREEKDFWILLKKTTW